MLKIEYVDVLGNQKNEIFTNKYQDNFLKNFCLKMGVDEASVKIFELDNVETLKFNNHVQNGIEVDLSYTTKITFKETIETFNEVTNILEEVENVVEEFIMIAKPWPYDMDGNFTGA